MHIVLKAMGAALSLFSAVFLLVYAAMLIDPAREERTVVLVALMLLLAGTLACGVYLVRAGVRRAAEGVEKRLLELASDKGGALSAEEAAMATRMDLRQCQRHLDALSRQGVCQPLVTELGGMRYVFPGLLSEDGAGEHPLGKA